MRLGDRLPEYEEQNEESGGGLATGIGVACAVLFALAVAAAFILTRAPAHEIVTPDRAGAFRRDTAAEGRYAQKFDAWKLALSESLDSRVTAADVVTAVYRKEAADGTAQQVVFLGGTGDVGDPDEAVQRLLRWGGDPSVRTRIGRPHDGERCAWYGYTVVNDVVDTDIVAVCAWATENSFGMLVHSDPDTIHEFPGRVAGMRPDLERVR